MLAGGRQAEAASPQTSREAYGFSPIRIVAFSLGAALVFLQVSMLHQALAFVTGFWKVRPAPVVS